MTDCTKRLSCLLFAVLACLPAAAAADDVQLWTEAGLRYEIDKRFSLKFDQHLRIQDDITRIESVMPELAVRYRPAKFLRLEAGYRTIVEPYDGGQHAWTWHRFHADARLRLRFGPVRLSYRLRFQETFGWTGFEGEEEFDSEQAIRNKLGLEIELGAGLDPFLSTELFNRLDDARRALFKWRLTAGLGTRLGSHRFELFYRLQVYLFDDHQGKVQHSTGEKNHILALGYRFRF